MRAPTSLSRAPTRSATRALAGAPTRLALALVLLGPIAPLASALSGIITDPTQVTGQHVDYVVVGGGLGGLVVANRLSEEGVSVLVIEAGGDDRTDPRVYDPYAYGQAFNSELSWSWPTVQGKTILGGKTLGGSTSINGMTQTRAQSAQYDALSSLLDDSSGGDAGGRWTWAGMFSAMLKSEGFSAPNDQQRAAGASSNPAFHNTSGPLQVTYPDAMYHGNQQKWFKQVASGNFSVPASADADGGEAAVVAFHPNTINWHSNDDRSSSATAYYSPIEHRPNIAILVGHQTTKILTTATDSGVSATGVEFGTRGGSGYTVYANREVVVSAGAIQTPALLQLSGIGDAALLEGLGIGVVVDLPGVGNNLQEQTMDSIGWTPVPDFDPQGRGPSDVIAYPDIDALFGTDASTVRTTITDNYKTYAADAAAAGAVVSPAAGEAIFAVQRDLMVDSGVGLAELFFDTGYPNGGLGINVWQLLPFSRGTVTIASTDPFEYPRIDPRYFTAPIDMQIQLTAARTARNIFKTDPLRSLVTSENVPAGAVPDDGEGGSDDDWREWIEQDYVSVAHPIGTCSMMRRDLGGVVDAHLLVYGTHNLRIVDASVLPLQLSAHLAASLYGLAENAADIIRSA